MIGFKTIIKKISGDKRGAETAATDVSFA